jgi:tRNA threonylcarbamoyladenosine biosynthesis protein TsaB
MLIVAIDTSGKNGSIGAFDVNAGGTAVDGHMDDLSGQSYSEELIPKLTGLLQRANRKKSDIDGFVVASGPGSFTGLRVGLATVKALADALNKPIAAVSVLEAMAQGAVQGRFLVVLDAGRKQVYVAEFSGDRSRAIERDVRLLDLASFIEESKGDSAPVLTSDANLAEFLKTSGRNVTIVAHPKANQYARIGAERMLAGKVVSPAELDADYVRRSDAEVGLKAPR